MEALPYNKVSLFIEKLRQNESISSLALEFAILTATRTNETLLARWSEINVQEAYWHIPEERMKAKREHRVPLSNRALEILRKVKILSDGEYVFQGSRRDYPLSN